MTSPSLSFDDSLSAPEATLLGAALRSRRLARRLARAPGGWRDLSAHELEQLGLAEREQRAVLALQQLVRSSYPEIPKHTFIYPAQVAAVYSLRLGALVHEVMLALALSGRHQFLGEIEVARGGLHTVAFTPSDVLRPLIRIGASGFVLVHNHPSGDPEPSLSDLKMTRDLARVANAVGLSLVDHIIIAGRGRGHCSMLASGFLSEDGQPTVTAS